MPRVPTTADVSNPQRKGYDFRLDNLLFRTAVSTDRQLVIRSTELNAVLGLEQIQRLDSNIEARVQNLKIWLENLDPVKYFVDFKVEGNSNYALPLVWSDPNSKAAICALLEEQGVEYRLGTAGGGNQARQPYLERYGHCIVGALAVSDYIQDQGLYIGNHPELTEEQILDLCRRLNNV